jgi:hypothetical protein
LSKWEIILTGIDEKFWKIEAGDEDTERPVLVSFWKEVKENLVKRALRSPQTF